MNEETLERRGPFHADGCLAVQVKEALCVCRRGAWLDELVPRAQARAELAAQLAQWATEQRIFAESALDAQRPELGDPPASNWAREGVRAAARMAAEVYIGIRRTALAIRDESTKRDPEHPVPMPDEPAEKEKPPTPPPPPVSVPEPRPVEDLAVQGTLL